jgi:colanic acid/amylovoran biosynthesis glycosyltransferase
MNLLYVTAGLPFARSETFVVPEIAELRRRGHAVRVVPVRPDRAVLHEDARFLVPLSTVRPVLSLGILWGAALEGIRRPRRIVRAAVLLCASRSARVLLKNLVVFPKGVWLARLARRLGVDHIHVHWAGTSATVGLVASEVSGIPWSFTAHRWDIPENNLLAHKARSASFVRAIDRRGCDELRSFVGSHARKLHVVHMGVDLPAFAPRAHYGAPSALRAVMAAFFVEKKGHAYAVAAIALLRSRGVRATLDLAGDGPLRDRIEHDARNHGVDSDVRLLGLVSHDELLAGLVAGRWDVALLPSVVASDGQKEGIPVFLMEAMAAGVPVVATNNGGIPELVQDAGLIVPERDADALADALEQLRRDPSAHARLAILGRRRVEQDFSVRSTAAALAELMERASGCSAADASAHCDSRSAAEDAAGR